MRLRRGSLFICPRQMTNAHDMRVVVFNDQTYRHKSGLVDGHRLPFLDGGTSQSAGTNVASCCQLYIQRTNVKDHACHIIRLRSMKLSKFLLVQGP